MTDLEQFKFDFDIDDKEMDNFLYDMLVDEGLPSEYVDAMDYDEIRWSWNATGRTLD